MATVMNRNEALDHLFSIPELDFSGDLFAERLGAPWFRLGARTVTSRSEKRGVEDVVERQSFLLVPTGFADIYDKLESIGNVLDRLGKPTASVSEEDKKRVYRYAPFHRFELPFTSVVGEPLVFFHSTAAHIHLVVTPDLLFFFNLEEKTPGNGIWWSPRRGVEILLNHAVDEETTHVVDIRTDYLTKYLRARRMSLVVGHYRHLHLYHPSHDAVGLFIKEDIELGSPEHGTKVILQNRGLRDHSFPAAPFLQRRLHLWFEVKPPEIDIDDPWAEEPPFDPYSFTLPTREGPVAPARWKLFRNPAERTFAGETCDFMTPVYFRQEVLMKYQGAAGFEVADDGSVSCLHYWGLVRSTRRLGNELLATGIGDFAEGVPFEEWPHWRQHAVEPPTLDTERTLTQEKTVPDAVNALVDALHGLNGAFACLTSSFPAAVSAPLWNGSLDSLAGRQLKWVYPVGAADDEFLKRATLASTLVIEALKPSSLRNLLRAVDASLCNNAEDPPRPLGSRKLLQWLTLVSMPCSGSR